MRQDRIEKYWDKEWPQRIVGHGQVVCNAEKFDFILHELWKKPQFSWLKKLEIGCGIGTHVLAISNVYPQWKDTWTGVDISNVAIKEAQSYGLDAICCNIYDFENNDLYDLFLLFDVLEHLESHDLVADKIKQFSNKQYIIFGNIPLYRNKQEEFGGYERHMDINILKDFINKAGCKNLSHHIYGIDGYPYMIFEGKNE